MSFQAIDLKSANVNSTALAISSTLFNFATTTLDAAQKAVVSAYTQAIVVSHTSVTPTATLGIPVAALGSLTVTGHYNVANLRFLSQASTATVSVQLER